MESKHKETVEIIKRMLVFLTPDILSRGITTILRTQHNILLTPERLRALIKQAQLELKEEEEKKS